MKKILLTIILTVLPILTLVLVSCGRNSQKNNLPGDSSSGDNGVIMEKYDDNYTDGICLSEWLMRADSDDIGMQNGWYQKYTALGWDKINFPGMFDYEKCIWFSVKFNADLDINKGERVLIRFSGMPYYTEYWLNGEYVGEHTGRVGAFTFDITDYIKQGEDNHIAVRCINPSSENDIEGLKYNNIGLSFSSNPRVQEPVYIYVKPEVYAEDAVIYTDCENGTVDVELTVRNSGDEAADVMITGSLFEDGKDMSLDRVIKTITADPGVTSQKITLELKDFCYWSPENPFLYRGVFTIENSNGRSDTVSRSVAFRTFKVNDDGFFELNGKPYYIKATFSGNVVEMSFDNGENIDYYYKMITYLKSCGFNTIRSLDCVPLPEVLDMCDKLGMLVYSEHPMAWHKVDDEEGRVAGLFKESVIATLKTLRSHPCVVMFGFQNETDVVFSGANKTSDIYETIKSGPSWARDYAKDMVFFLSSGRFDGNLSLGSASNPGSYTWDGYMGNESADASDELISQHISNTYSRDMGDIHYYPLQPYGYSVYQAYKDLESYKKGVLLSEAGTGSLYDIFAITADRELNGQPIHNVYPAQISDFKAYYENYKLDYIFSSPEAVIRASNELSAKQRFRLLTYIRSIGKINGYFMTGLMDNNGLGEGIVNEYADYKDGYSEALSEGFANLRFCVVTDSLTYYIGDTISFDLVVSDLSLMLDATKEYTVTVSIRGETGTAWQKNYTFKPVNNSFVTDICSESVEIDFDSGKYIINVEFVSGAIAECTDYEIQVFDRDNLTDIKGITIYTYGINNDVKQYLSDFGSTVKEYIPGDKISSSVVLIGDIRPNDEQLTRLVELADNGCHVIFLSKSSYINEKGTIRTQLGISGSIMRYNNWLYHGESIVYKNSVTSGLDNGCLMDTLYYECIYSPDYIYKATAPDDVSIGAISLGGNDVGLAFEFRGGYQLGTYTRGKGCITINCLNLTEYLGTPVADTVFCNLLVYYQ